MQTDILNVTVVIPNYNGLELLKKHLPFVMDAFRFKNNRIQEVIIIDDASTDESVNYIQKSYPQVRLIRHKVNRGFAASVNMGVRMAKTEFVCLLNSDVSPTESFLVKVLPHFKDKNVFGVSLREDGFGYAKGLFKDGFIVHEPLEGDSPANTFWISGGSGVFRRDTWFMLGGLDEKLFAPFYWEDVDISYRALKRGFKLIWEPDSLVYHKHESTIKKFDPKFKNRIWERNQLLFIWKNMTSARLSRRHIVGLARRTLRHPGYLRIVLMALFKLRAVLSARRRQRKEGRISDEAIFASFS